MELSYSEALGLLGTDSYKSVDSLVSLLNETSAKVAHATDDSIYLLYSGTTSDGGTWSTNLAQSVKSQSGGVVVDLIDSDVGRLVNDPEFRLQLGKAITRQVLSGSDDLSLATSEQRSEITRLFREIYEGKDAVGTNRVNSNSLIDIAWRPQKLSATPDLSGTVLPLCLIPNSASKSAPPFN